LRGQNQLTQNLGGDCVSELDYVLRQLADKLMHDLPEEIAAAITMKLHEGGDALILTYPSTWHGTPEMHTLDTVARSYGAAFVSRGPGESYYLVPRPTVKKVESPPSKQLDSQPQQPVKASQPTKPTPDLTEVCRQLTEVNAKLAELTAAVQKIADRPSYHPAPKKELPLERHTSGNIIWLYDTNRVGERYEKALAEENRDSPEYKALERMLFDAATAGKKGLLQDGKWYFLSTDQNWIGRKKARDFTNGGAK
jgi:hypothetical protein